MPVDLNLKLIVRTAAADAPHRTSGHGLLLDLRVCAHGVTIRFGARGKRGVDGLPSSRSHLFSSADLGLA